MEVVSLEEQLKNNPEYVLTVLEKLGYHPHDKGNYFSMRNLDGDNESAIVIWKNTLVYNNYTRNKRGNIFTLVMDVANISFPKAIKQVAKWCGIKDNHVRISYPFGGFYRNLDNNGMGKISFKVYKNGSLPASDCLSKKFFDDNIDYLTQERFGVRYDHESDSVLIPIYDYRGRLVGCKGRRNDPNVDFGSRWYAYLPYTKTNIVYGWFQNYKSIVEKGICIITESEKGPQQLASMDCNLGLAVGSHDISSNQALYIKALKCKTIIIAFDEDVDEEKLIIECAKVKTDTNRVYYIKDREHRYLKADSKNAPTDLGRSVFDSLVKNCLVKYKPELKGEET